MKSNEPNFATLTVSAPTLAAFLGVSAPTVRELAAQGVIEKTGHGKYALMESTRRAFQHLRAQAAQTPTAPRLVTARARIAEAEAEIREQKLGILSGKLMHMDDAVAAWGTLLRRTRNIILAIPSRVGARLGHLTRADIAVIDDEIRTALTELAETERSDLIHEQAQKATQARVA